LNETFRYFVSAFDCPEYFAVVKVELLFDNYSAFENGFFVRCNNCRRAGISIKYELRRISRVKQRYFREFIGAIDIKTGGYEK